MNQDRNDRKELAGMKQTQNHHNMCLSPLKTGAWDGFTVKPDLSLFLAWTWLGPSPDQPRPNTVPNHAQLFKNLTSIHIYQF